MDKDGHANVPDTFEQALESKTGIHIAFTAQCFEYFVLLHFVRTTKAFGKCDDVIHDVKGHLLNYQKATDILGILTPYMRTGLANSEWSMERSRTDLDTGRRPCELSSYSNIHERVNYMLSLID